MHGWWSWWTDNCHLIFFSNGNSCYKHWHLLALYMTYLPHIAIMIWSMLEIISFCQVCYWGTLLFSSFNNNYLNGTLFFVTLSILRKRLFLEPHFRLITLLKESFMAWDLTPLALAVLFGAGLPGKDHRPVCKKVFKLLRPNVNAYGCWTVCIKSLSHKNMLKLLFVAE